MRGGLVATSALLLVLACESGPKHEPSPSSVRSAAAASEPSGAAAASAAEPAPIAEGKPGSGKLVRCGWGAANAEPGVEAPPWVIALVDVEASRAIVGLRVYGAELYAGESEVARASGEGSIRVQQGANTLSLGAVDTVDLSGPLPAGASRLRVGSRLEGTMKSITAKKPTRCRIVLTDENGDNVVVEGPLEASW